MTTARLLGSKWMLAAGMLAVLALTAGQSLADHPQGGYYRSHVERGGYGHHPVPFYGRERFEGRPFYYAPPVVYSRPVYRPYGYTPVYGRVTCVPNGLGITIIIR